MAERNKLNFTDRELYSISLAIESHLNSRDTYMSKGGAKVFNSVIKKICDEGMKRKDPKSILHPIFKFEEDE